MVGLDDPFLDFCRQAVAFRKAHPVLRQERFLTGETAEDGRIEIAWYKPDGSFMDDGAWNDDGLQVLGGLRLEERAMHRTPRRWTTSS